MAENPSNISEQKTDYLREAGLEAYRYQVGSNNADKWNPSGSYEISQGMLKKQVQRPGNITDSDIDATVEALKINNTDTVKALKDTLKAKLVIQAATIAAVAEVKSGVLVIPVPTTPVTDMPTSDEKLVTAGSSDTNTSEKREKSKKPSNHREDISKWTDTKVQEYNTKYIKKHSIIGTSPNTTKDLSGYLKTPSKENIKKLQKMVQAHPDGVMGKKTKQAIEKYLSNTTPVGEKPAEAKSDKKPALGLIPKKSPSAKPSEIHGVLTASINAFDAYIKDNTIGLIRKGTAAIWTKPGDTYYKLTLDTNGHVSVQDRIPKNPLNSNTFLISKSSDLYWKTDSISPRQDSTGYAQKLEQILTRMKDISVKE